MNKPSFIVGIDVAAESFVASLSENPSNPYETKEQIANNPEGFHLFMEWLKEHKASKENTVVLMEATGVYGEALCYFLAAQGYRVVVENPLKVKRAFDLSGHKNDAVDSRRIAEYGHRFFDELTFWKAPDDIIEQLQQLLSAREQFTKQAAALKNSLKSFERKPVKTPLVLKTHRETLTQLKANIKALDQEIQKFIRKDPTFRQTVTALTSIPGVGVLMASHMLVLTRGFKQTVNPKQLSAYLGICPYEHSSGTSVRRRPKCRRYGPVTLRKLTYLAALTVRRYNPSFQQYFMRKVAEGKSKRLVINNISNKLVKLMCAIMKSSQPYNENYRSVNPLYLKAA